MEKIGKTAEFLQRYRKHPRDSLLHVHAFWKLLGSSSSPSRKGLEMEGWLLEMGVWLKKAEKQEPDVINSQPLSPVARLLSHQIKPPSLT